MIDKILLAIWIGVIIFAWWYPLRKRKKKGEFQDTSDYQKCIKKNKEGKYYLDKNATKIIFGDYDKPFKTPHSKIWDEKPMSFDKFFKELNNNIIDHGWGVEFKSIKDGEEKKYIQCKKCGSKRQIISTVPAFCLNCDNGLYDLPCEVDIESKMGDISQAMIEDFEKRILDGESDIKNPKGLFNNREMIANAIKNSKEFKERYGKDQD